MTEPAAKQIRVQYYALLREEAGRSEEAVATRAKDPRALFAELHARHPFSLPLTMLLALPLSLALAWRVTS